MGTLGVLPEICLTNEAFGAPIVIAEVPLMETTVGALRRPCRVVAVPFYATRTYGTSELLHHNNADTRVPVGQSWELPGIA